MRLPIPELPLIGRCCIGGTFGRYWVGGLSGFGGIGDIGGVGGGDIGGIDGTGGVVIFGALGTTAGAGAYDGAALGTLAVARDIGAVIAGDGEMSGLGEYVGTGFGDSTFGASEVSDGRFAGGAGTLFGYMRELESESGDVFCGGMDEALNNMVKLYHG